MSSDQAKKYHSVNFGEKNTWDDWGLIPTSRPSVAPLAVLENDNDADSTDGAIDTTEVFGQVCYTPAKGTMEFLVTNPGTSEYSYTGWVQIRNDVLNYLHNRRRRMVLDDDPDHYYEGRFQVSFSGGKNWSKVTIEYMIDTYHVSF